MTGDSFAFNATAKKNQLAPVMAGLDEVDDRSKFSYVNFEVEIHSAEGYRSHKRTKLYQKELLIQIEGAENV